MLHTLQEKIKSFLCFLKSKPASFVVLPLLFIGALLKNLLLQTFIAGTNSFKPQLFIMPGLLVTGLFFSFVTLLLLFSPSLLFKKGQHKMIYGSIISFLLTLLLLVDCYYYRSFSEIPSVTILSSLTGESSGAGTTAVIDSLIGLLSPYDLLYLTDYALLACYLLFKKLYKKEETLKEQIKKQKEHLVFLTSSTLHYRFFRFLSLSSLCIAILLFLPALYALGAAEQPYYDVYDPAYTHNTVFYFTPIGYHAANIVNNLENHVPEDPQDPTNSEESDEERRQRELIELFLNQKEILPHNDYAGLFKGKNVILLQMESFENLALGQSIDGVEITPNLNSLIAPGASSLYFPNIYDQAKAGNSSDCDLMINTSFFPTTDVFFRTYTQDAQPSMPVILRSKGYKTYYYNGSGKNSVWSYPKVYSQVFGYITDETDPNCNFHMVTAPSNEDKIYRYTSDEYTLQYVLEDLKQKQDAKSSFFSQVILCSSHMPFRYDNLAYEENRNLIPEEYWLPIPENKELANSKTFHYLNALHYVDAQIGIFLENAAAEGLLDNTIVLLYGDHLGLHKYYPNEAESIAEEYPEYAFVNQSTFNSLPLIIYDPSGTLKGKSFDLPGGQTDIMPTLLYLLGIDQREYPFAMGKNLLNTQRRYTVISNGTVIGTVQNEESVRNILLMYKISETLIKQDYFGYLVEDLRKEEPLPEK